MPIQSRPVLALVLFAAALVPADTALAGPPLFCPEAVFTDSESLGLRKIHKDDAPAQQVLILSSVIAGSDSARFHGEAIRWFRRVHSGSFSTLLGTIEARVEKLGDTATAQDRFDLALAIILDNWDGKRAKEAAVTLSEIADATGSPARLIYAAEAHDLVFHGSRATRGLASALSLAHCRRATEILFSASDEDSKRVQRLLEVHLPYLEGMHRGEAAWDQWIVERKRALGDRGLRGESRGLAKRMSGESVPNRRSPPARSDHGEQ